MKKIKIMKKYKKN